MPSTIPLWRQILRDNFTSFERLSTFLELNSDQKKELHPTSSFPLNLPRRLAEKIEKKTLDDPILRQFVPLKAELQERALFVKDPVGDCLALRTPKCLQKYDGRVLLLTTSACAMHCRFCFRQNFEYAKTQTDFDLELTSIQQNPSIKEVILSGGDPLSMGNTRLEKLLSDLGSIDHVSRLRFHTRFPIGIPERIDEAFLHILASCRLQIWFVIHCNHPKELDSEVLCALKKIQKLGMPVLNQAVLLKGVNDSIEVLQELCEKLIDSGIYPYYLHQLDRVQGAAHFEVSKTKGIELIEMLQQRIAGYGVPKYVEEIPKRSSKTLITQQPSFRSDD